jgi:hypothetical protein
MKAAAVECLVLMASGAPVEAMQIADQLMVVRSGHATDVIDAVCNYSLFMTNSNK